MNPIVYFMMLSPKQKAGVIILFLLMIFVVGIVIYNKKKKKQAEKEKLEKENKNQRTSPPSTATTPKSSQLILPLDHKGNIADLEPNVRAIYAQYHDNVFEAEKWAAQIPSINFPMAWQVKVLPAYKNAVIRYMVSSKAGSQVSVLFDPYGIHTDEVGEYWDVYCSELSTDNRATINLHDVKKLKLVISQMLKNADAQRKPILKPKPIKVKPANPKKKVDTNS
jgi:hypothetical protein